MPDEILDYMVETYDLVGQMVDKASLNTAGGRETFKKRLCDVAAKVREAEKGDSEDDDE